MTLAWIALVVSILTLAYRLRAFAVQRRLDALEFAKKGTRLAMRARIVFDEEGVHYQVEVVNLGMLATTISDVGAIALNPTGVFTRLQVTDPEIVGKVIEGNDSFAFSLPWEKLKQLRDQLPNSDVFMVIGAAAGSYSLLGPKVPMALSFPLGRASMPAGEVGYLEE